ncbi:major facilitator superfamily domain-containing protein [Talaromyces proteolyticus]|uniref:Major facilitator superfamily domain-containing protein n=1 Tax=Talaromyces proteolyticus TaxID=1131652 RepID=A0AAD4PV77_9EURO|nr:major facilitator superfamily domain-containing protein [Talaromyces proteolyticus]KAH8689998.1 major facilitator superfamily domain-containing protein [Talaromyces proteolyticus]
MSSPTEYTSLLDRSAVSTQSSRKWKATWKKWRTPILCYAVALTFDFAESMRSTPRTQLFEWILCERYYSIKMLKSVGMPILNPNPSVGPTPHMCRIDTIQTQVNSVRAWLKIGENFFAAILAIPFGKLANTKGRKLVLALGIIGQLLAEMWTLAVCFLSTHGLPLSTVYISVLLRSLGGGQMVLSAILHAIVADVVTEEKRARAFFHMASMTLISELLGPAVGSVLMTSYNAYIPLLAVLPLQLGSIAAVIAMQDTVRFTNEDNADFGNEDEESDNGSTMVQESTRLTISQALRIFLKWMKMACRIFNRENIPILLVHIGFLTSMVARETLDSLVQYVSNRFGWTLAEANYLVSLKALVNLILFLLLLPLISGSLIKYTSMSSRNADLWIARGSSLFGVIGPTLLGIASSPLSMILSLILFTLSSGYPHVIQSYGTFLVKPADVAPFYSSLAMVRIVGTLVASPLLAMAFNIGLERRGDWFGILYYTAGILFCFAAFGAWGLK